MILFTILLLALALLATVVVVAVSVGGSIFVVVFGDVIVCMVFIALIIRYLIKRKKK